MARNSVPRTWPVEQRDVDAVDAIARKYSLSRGYVVRIAIRRLTDDIDQSGPAVLLRADDDAEVGSE